MAQPPSGTSKGGDLRAAAERMERGIEKYAAGDLVGALTEFEEAVRLHPVTARGRQYAAWVRDLQSGKRAIPGQAGEGLDEEALRAVTEALDVEESGQRKLGTAPTMQVVDRPEPERERKLTPSPPGPGKAPPPPPAEERARRPTVPPPADERARRPTPPPAVSRERVATPPPALDTSDTTVRERRPDPSRTPTLDGGESPWDPVPLTPTHHQDSQPVLRRSDVAAAASSAVPPSSTLHGMPPLESRVVGPASGARRKKPGSEESVTREFRSTPTGANLRPLDVPELTDEQIQGLLALGSPDLPESKTMPSFELERLDSLEDSSEQRLIEMDAAPEPLPLSSVSGLRNDTSPMGVQSFTDPTEFDPQQLTPTGIKPTLLKAVRAPEPEDDPYADLHLMPLDVGPDHLGGEEPEDGTNPTNPFIRGPHLAEYVQAASDSDAHELPPMPTLPGARVPELPSLATAEAALAAGKLAAAVDALEAVLAGAGGLGGELARAQQPLLEQIFAAILRGPDRIPVHGQATSELDPRSAFLLSRIDGSMTVEDVLDVSGMPRLEALRMLALLVRRGAVVVK